MSSRKESLRVSRKSEPILVPARALLAKAPLVEVVLARGPKGCVSPVVAITDYETNIAGDRHPGRVMCTTSPVRGLPAPVDWLERTAKRPASQPHRPST